MLLLLLCLLFSTLVFSQNKTIKSLRSEIKTTTSPNKKAKLNYDLADLYRKNLNVDSAYFFAKKTFEFYQKKNIDSLTVKSALQLNRIAKTTIKKDSIDYLSIAQKIAESSSDKSLLIETAYSKGQEP